MSINLLLDSADPNAWAEWLKSGVFHGITTNPSLLRKAGQPCNIKNIQELAKQANNLGCKELHLQTWGSNSKDLFERGFALTQLSLPEMRVYIKVPITKTGCEAAKLLIKEDIPVTFTACYETKQVLIADSIGASYLAPYLGRINDLKGGESGIHELVRMKQILDNLESDCEILLASIRKIKDISYLLSFGIRTFTLSEKLTEELFNSANTFNASNEFEADASS